MSAGGGDDLRERNREILADRLGWPGGAVEACRELEAEFPGWHTWYRDGGLPREPEAGYTAYREHARYGEQSLFGRTPDELAKKIAESERVTWWRR